MKIEVAQEVFALFPGYVRHVLLVKNANNTKEDLVLAGLLEEAQHRVRNDESFADLKTHPLIASWRDAFQA